ncbi:hypothetical protein THOM_0135 [Trachipleistophora hominis]|uniref:Uncharacterized protein n=1 Tax=Trachipleistophora hominis TaxID=72359 RepID=L7K0B8_TRAHO|nr:hypothetical protein THOM_0135 [Trachipleistophora hominis]
MIKPSINYLISMFYPESMYSKALVVYFHFHVPSLLPCNFDNPSTTQAMRLTYKPLQRRKSKMLTTVNLDDDIDKYWTNATKVLDNDVYDLEEFSFLEKSVNLEEMDGKGNNEKNIEINDMRERTEYEHRNVMNNKQDNTMNVQNNVEEQNDNNVISNEQNIGTTNPKRVDSDNSINSGAKVDGDQHFINFSSLEENSFSIGRDSDGVVSSNEKENNHVENISGIKAGKDASSTRDEKDNGLIAEAEPEKNSKMRDFNLRDSDKKKKKKSFFDFNTMKKIETAYDDDVSVDGVVEDKKEDLGGACNVVEDFPAEDDAVDYNVSRAEYEDEYAIDQNEESTNDAQQEEYAGQHDTSIGAVERDAYSRETAEERSKTRMKREELKEIVSVMPMRKSGKRKILQNKTNKKKDTAERDSKRKRRSSSNENMDSNIVSNISARQAKNGFVPLVIENNLETAVLNLQENAYIEDEAATKSFSFYVTKGKFTIKRGDKEFLLKRDGMLVINEGESFVCKGVSRGGNTGIVTYKIT